MKNIYNSDQIRETVFININAQISQNWTATKTICPSYESLRECIAIPFWADCIFPHLPKRGSCCRDILYHVRSLNCRHQRNEILWIGKKKLIADFYFFPADNEIFLLISDNEEFSWNIINIKWIR